MLVGFVHGVMNTDNTTISGETIDYGPCAFMDAFDPATVFSSIDERGRYAYGNQPQVLQWNLARLAEALLPLFDDNSEAAVEAATEVLNGFTAAYERHWAEGMAAKLGIAAPDRALAQDVLKLLRLQDGRFHAFLPRAVRRHRADAVHAAGAFRCLGRPPRCPAARGPCRGGRRDEPGRPRLHPAQPPRRRGARRGGRGRDGAVPPSRGTSFPIHSRNGPAGKTTPARHPVSCAPYVTYCGT